MTRNPQANYSTNGNPTNVNSHGKDLVNHAFTDNVAHRTRQTAQAASTSPRAIKTVASLQTVLDKIGWLWQDWLPLGHLSLLAGTTGIGKSALALRVAMSILEGNNWPDGKQPVPGKYAQGKQPSICWADTEASQAILVDRCEKWEVATGRILVPTPDDNPLSDLRLDDQKSWDALVDVIDREHPPLTVIDSLRGSHGGDENSSDLAGLLHKLAALARDKNIAILILHHVNKPNNSENPGEITLDRIRGTSAIPAMCRVVWALDTPDPNRTTRIRLSVIKSNLGLKPPPIGVEWRNDKIEFCDAPTITRTKSQGDHAKDIIRTLVQDGPCRATVCEEQLQQAGISAPTWNRAKAALGVKTSKRGIEWWWALPTPPDSD